MEQKYESFKGLIIPGHLGLGDNPFTRLYITRDRLPALTGVPILFLGSQQGTDSQVYVLSFKSKFIQKRFFYVC